MADFEINAADVAELRRETGAGMMDCKKALTESAGDKDKALEYLRKKGKAAAEKRADRSANEGVIVCRRTPDGRTAALVEVNSETDFVSKNDAFVKYAQDVADFVLGWTVADSRTVDDLKDQAFPSGAKIGDVLSDLVGRVGEKLEIRRFVRNHTDKGYIGDYIHSDSKLGVLVVLEGITNSDPDAFELGRDLAMQIAASAPTVVKREDVPQERIDYEHKFHTEQTQASGKPAAVIEKIVQGKLDKWFGEIVLLEQPFVKDSKVTIKSLVEEVSKSHGKHISVKSFVRLRIGE